MNNLGNIIKEIRDLKKISIEQLAENTKFSVKILTRLESGSITYSDYRLKKISKVLNIPFSILKFLNLTEDEVMYPEEFKLIYPIIERLLIDLLKKKIDEQK
jgi:transcriptional regulator with XRE-family HTH domain